MEQLALNFVEKNNQESWIEGSYIENLIHCLNSDLNFQENSNGFHPAHKIHSFPAKFPPQLPRKFILALTEPGDVVLDSMAGSGTSLFEALLLGRQAIGLDIDPLAILLSKVKEHNYDKSLLYDFARKIITNSYKSITSEPDSVFLKREEDFDSETCEFIDYWFSKEIQIELLALLNEINNISEKKIADFFKLIFSSMIITKTGGVSLAIDLAHTRPHRARTVIANDGQLLFGDANDVQDKKHLTKRLRSPLDEFKKKFDNIIKCLVDVPVKFYPSLISYGNAKAAPLKDNSIDLIVTSPPYASNAIDYMRAHKFSLVWFGYPINELKHLRKKFIGSEGTYNGTPVKLPQNVQQVISRVEKRNKSKSTSLHRYYSEMFLALKEMHRVLKPGKAAIVVVGNSTLAGEDIEIEKCFVSIGKNIGFEVPQVGVRQLDRNRRMLPASSDHGKSSQIQQRMHEEYVIGFYKPTN